MRTAVGSHAVAARRLRRALSGAVHLPGEGGYDDAAPVAARDDRPVAGDGRRGVRSRRRPGRRVTAREHDLPLAVQATGHGTHVPADGAVLLKTSAMAAVLVDPDRRVARVGPGARWGASSPPRRRSASRRSRAPHRTSA